MAHPADESKREIIVHGWLPLLIAVAVLLLSICADIKTPGIHWAQRAGSIVTVLGAYVAYRDAKCAIKNIGGAMFVNLNLPYRLIAVAMLMVGTLVWGYGDLFI